MSSYFKLLSLVCLLEYNCKADPILITAHAEDDGRPLATDPPCDETTGDYYEVSSDWPHCTRNYIECKNGHITHKKCSLFKRFDPETLTCRLLTHVTCSDKSRHTFPDIYPNCMSTEKGQNFPDPNEASDKCKRYIECTKTGEMIPTSCGLSYHFNPYQGECVWLHSDCKFDTGSTTSHPQSVTTSASTNLTTNPVTSPTANTTSPSSSSSTHTPTISSSSSSTPQPTTPTSSSSTPTPTISSSSSSTPQPSTPTPPKPTNSSTTSKGNHAESIHSGLYFHVLLSISVSFMLSIKGAL